MRDLVVRGMAWTAFQKWSVRVTSLITFAVLARLLAPEDFGLVALAFAATAVLNLIVDMGSGAYLIQKETLEPEDVDTCFWASFIVACLIALPLALGAPLVAAATGFEGLALVLQLSALGMVVSSLSIVPSALLRRDLHFKSLALRGVLATNAGAIAGVVAALTGAGAASLVIQQITYSAVGAVVLLAANATRPGRRISFRRAGGVYRYGLPLLSTSAVGLIGTHGVNAIVGGVLGPAALGLYAVAGRLALIVSDLLVTVFSAVALPVFSRLASQPSSLARFYLRAVTLSTAAAGLGLGVLAGSANVLLPAVFGRQWADASAVATLLLVTGFIASATYFDGSLLIVADRKAQYLRLAVFDAAGTLLLFWVLLPQGLPTAAWGKIALSVVVWLLYGRAVSRSSEVFQRQTIAAVMRNGAAGTAAGLSAWGITLTMSGNAATTLLSAVPVGLLVGAAVLWLLVSPVREEVRGAISSFAERRARSRQPAPTMTGPTAAAPTVDRPPMEEGALS